MTNAFKANLLLMLTAFIWGTAFVAQRAGMESVGPITYTGVRFMLGVITLIPLLVWQARKGPSAPLGHGTSRGKALGGVLLAGLALLAGVTLQQIGLVHTTAGKAGFITGLYVVIVPLMGLFLGQRPGLGGVLGAAAAAVGLYLLSVTSDFSMEIGDVYVMIGAFAWAAHVHILGRLSPRMNCIKLACGQFLLCSLASLAMAPIFETITIQGLMDAALPIAYGGIMSVGVAYTLQVVAQKDAAPTAAAVILSMETVFAALAGWVLLGEILSLRGIAGCGLMLAGMLAAQLWPASSPKRS